MTKTNSVISGNYGGLWPAKNRQKRVRFEQLTFSEPFFLRDSKNAKISYLSRILFGSAAQLHHGGNLLAGCSIFWRGIYGHRGAMFPCVRDCGEKVVLGLSARVVQ